MEIRRAELSDRPEIVALYIKSQAKTGLPDSNFISPDTLGDHLYAREAIERCIAVQSRRIVGHGLIEKPNPLHMDTWRSGMKLDDDRPILELGGAFVDPEYAGRGVWTELLVHRLEVVQQELASIAVSATWSRNKHVKKRFVQLGGHEVGQEVTDGGPVSLYVF